jgi:hypothetical protein
MSSVLKTVSIPKELDEQYRKWKKQYDKTHLGTFNLSAFVQSKLKEILEE